MPRYFFDVHDGERHSRDERGIELPAVAHIWKIAVPMVDKIAKSKNHMHPPHTVSVVVRDAYDVVVYRSGQIMNRTTSKANPNLDFEKSDSNRSNAHSPDTSINHTEIKQEYNTINMFNTTSEDN